MSEPQSAFVAALERAAQALAEAERLWAAHPDVIDAVVDGTPYPPGLPSFDEFVANFAAWREAVAVRRPAPNGSGICLRQETGFAAQKAAVQPPPFGPGWDATTASLLTRFEVWGTTMAAPDDFCEFRGFTGDTLVATFRLPGY